MEQLTYADAISEYRLFEDSGDPWGSVMHWWFTVAEEMHNRSLVIPDAWQYRQSPLGPQNDPDDHATTTAEALPDSDLIKLGKILDRYARVLKRAGKDY